MGKFTVVFERELVNQMPITVNITGAKSHEQALESALKKIREKYQSQKPSTTVPEIVCKEYDPNKPDGRPPFVRVIGERKTKYYTWSFAKTNNLNNDSVKPESSKKSQSVPSQYYIVTAWFDEHDAVPVALCSTEKKAKDAIKIVDEKATEMQREGEISNYSCHYERMQLDVLDWFDIKKKL